MSTADELRNIMESTDCARGQWEPLLDALVTEQQAWETALHRWGRHENGCTALDPGGSCSCGLTPFAWPDDADYLRDRDDKLRIDALEATRAEMDEGEDER